MSRRRLFGCHVTYLQLKKTTRDPHNYTNNPSTQNCSPTCDPTLVLSATSGPATGNYYLPPRLLVPSAATCIFIRCSSKLTISLLQRDCSDRTPRPYNLQTYDPTAYPPPLPLAAVLGIAHPPTDPRSNTHRLTTNLQLPTPPTPHVQTNFATLALLLPPMPSDRREQWHRGMTGGNPEQGVEDNPLL